MHPKRIFPQAPWVRSPNEPGNGILSCIRLMWAERKTIQRFLFSTYTLLPKYHLILRLSILASEYRHNCTHQWYIHPKHSRPLCKLFVSSDVLDRPIQNRKYHLNSTIPLSFQQPLKSTIQKKPFSCDEDFTCKTSCRRLYNEESRFTETSI